MTARSKQKTEAAKAKKAAPKTSKKRLRLTPDVRRQQILDAALIEFGALGFAGASVAKIALRAGTSKANLYVHFKNKDEIFEALLRDLLVPSNTVWSPKQPGQDMGERIDAFIEKTYDGLTPHAISIIRLLISESHRIPELIQLWHEETMAPARARQQDLFKQYVAEGAVRDSPLTDHFSFVMAPLIYAAVIKMVFRQDVADIEYQKIKETHRKMLHLLLVPEAESD